MTLATDHIPQTAPVPHAAAVEAAPAQPTDQTQKRAIADAVWTDLLWLMPRPHRSPSHGGNVSVELGPPDRAAFPASH